MRRIADVANGLGWLQPNALKSEYELRSGEELVETLKFRGMFGTLATAECADGAWTFKRVGFWQHRATIRAQGSDADLAVFRNNTWASGGELTFQDGRTFRASTNLWMTRFAFTGAGDEPLVRFHYGGVFHRSADVELAPEARTLPELPLLVLFGWYLVIMLDRDAGAVAAASAG